MSRVVFVAVVVACAVAAARAIEARVAADSVTIDVSPQLLTYGQKPRVEGVVAGAGAGASVTVQFKQCGLAPAQFRDFLETKTTAGGAWSLYGLPHTSTSIPSSGVFRAVSRGNVSREVAVQMRALVRLERAASGFRVTVAGTQSFWRRQVVVERFTRRLGKWVKVRRVSLTQSRGGAYAVPVIFNFSETFRVRVPKGTPLRAVLPPASARPCYLGAVSRLVRT